MSAKLGVSSFHCSIFISLLQLSMLLCPLLLLLLLLRLSVFVGVCRCLSVFVCVCLCLSVFVSVCLRLSPFASGNLLMSFKMLSLKGAQHVLHVKGPAANHSFAYATGSSGHAMTL